MVFSSKVDKYFLSIIVSAILIMGVVISILLLLDDELTTTDGYIMLVVFFLSTVFLLWLTLTNKYTFHQNHLVVKGGPFRSRIPYNEITKISPTSEILTGYRLLSSKESYELFYKTGILGSVKISPKESKRFISELKKRCPSIEIQN